MLAEIKYLTPHLPQDQQTKDWYRAYAKAYDFGPEQTMPIAGGPN